MKRSKILYSISTLSLALFASSIWFSSDASAQNENDPRSTKNVVTEKPLGREIIARRTLKSKTFFNPGDNTLTTVINSGYVHYRDRDDRLRDIDRRIVPSQDSSQFQVKKGLFSANFDFNLVDTEYPVTFETEDSSRFGAKLTALAYFDQVSKRIQYVQQTQKSKSIVNGNKIRFTEAFPDVDVEYEYADTKLKQQIYLSQQARKNLPDPTPLGFNSPNAYLVVVTQLDVPDSLEVFAQSTKISTKMPRQKVRLTYEGKDAVHFRNSGGKLKFLLTQDFAFTTSGPDSVAPNQSPTSNKVASLTMLRRFYTSGGENFMLTGVPLSWLDSQPAGTIVLDPTVSISPPTDDVWIEYNRSSNYNAYTQIRIGRGNTYGWKRSLVKFDVSAIPPNANIQSASLDLYFYSKWGSTIVTRTIQCHQLLKDWKEAQATWYNRLTGTSWGTNGVGLDDVDAKSAAEDSHDWYNEYPTWKNYDITSLTQKWVDGTETNYGVIFWATNEDDYTNADEKWVYSSEYSDVSKRPKLIVSYSVDPLADYQYDAFGRPTSVTYANGVTETNQYDADRGWVTNRDYKNGGLNVFKFENPTYDVAGTLKKQRYQHTDASMDSMEYSYDTLAQITQFKHNTTLIRSYDYDDNGNLTTFTGKTLTYGNDNNQLTSDGSRSFTYDDVGRVKQIGSTAISYDIFNNMTGHGSDSYAYDAFNQRIRRTENSTSTYYVTSGPQILAEYTSDADPDAEYVYGLSGMAVRFDPAEGHHWFFTDHLGNTREMGLPGTSGDPDMLRDYYPYGDNYTVAGNDETAYQFTGKELDNGIGLHYFGSRYYDRSIGRWLAPDPAGQYFSPYVYVGNNPLNYVDPDGELGFLAIVAIGAAIGGTAGGVYAALNDQPVWQGALIGAASGAFLGSGLAVGGAYGAAVGSAAFNTAQGAAFDGAGGLDLLKYAGVGFATGYFGGTGGFGLSGSQKTARGFRVAGRLATQAITTAGRSIGNRWANPNISNGDIFDSFVVGAGPLNFRIGDGFPLTLRDNIFNAAFNGLGLLTHVQSQLDSRVPDGTIEFDVNSLSFNYKNELLRGFHKGFARATGAYAIWNASNKLLGPEGVHVWQSRFFNQLFLPTFFWSSFAAIARGENSYLGNFFERQAHGF